MWLFLVAIHSFTMALVNYIDEYLTQHSSVMTHKSIHERIGGVFLVTTLFGLLSLGTLLFVIDDVSMTSKGMNIALLSSIPMVVMFASYFYLGSRVVI